MYVKYIYASYSHLVHIYIYIRCEYIYLNIIYSTSYAHKNMCIYMLACIKIYIGRGFLSSQSRSVALIFSEEFWVFFRSSQRSVDDHDNDVTAWLANFRDQIVFTTCFQKLYLPPAFKKTVYYCE